MRKKIYIDAGHNNSGFGTGAVGNGMREQDINFDVAHALSGILERHGYDVRQSRPTQETNLGHDANSSINARWQDANAWGADYFVSIHVNASGGTGAETLFHCEDSRVFAQTVQDIYSAVMGLRNRRIWQRDNIGVLRWATMPAILIELAFIDAPPTAPDVDILRNKRPEMAVAVAKGILAHLGDEYVDESESTMPDPIPKVPKNNRLDIDVLGEVQSIEGYIENGKTMVWIRDIATAMGYVATWDEVRQMPVVKETNEANQSTPGSIPRQPIALTDFEIDLISRMVWSEARGEDALGQRLVVHVILNRLQNPNFPNFLLEVLAEPNAFAPVRDGSFNRSEVDENIRQRVLRALAEPDQVRGATHFRTIAGAEEAAQRVREGNSTWSHETHLTRLFDHGAHRFYV